MFVIRKILHSSMIYQLVMCFPGFPRAAHRDRFTDCTGTDAFTMLSVGVFRWLINILSDYLILRQGNVCTIEPYLQSRFACQFRHDQFYMSNPNLDLHFSGNLYDATVNSMPGYNMNSSYIKQIKAYSKLEKVPRTSVLGAWMSFFRPSSKLYKGKVRISPGVRSKLLKHLV